MTKNRVYCIKHNMKEVIKFNSYYEGLLQNLYAASDGCFVAFMQFFYQYNQSHAFEPDFCECFKFLYEKELQNCEILCDLLLLLGGDNKFYSSSRKFLSGYNVDYVKTFAKMFVCDIELLEVSVIQTKNLIAKIDEKQVKSSLLTILSNKKEELKMLKETYFKNNIV